MICYFSQHLPSLSCVGINLFSKMVSLPKNGLSVGLLAGLAFAIILVLFGAVPGVMCPAGGQAVWSMGFAESIAKGPIYGIYATDFGLPEPAGISFGLPGVLVASIFIRVGVYAPDAYAMSLALFLALAFYGCYAVSSEFGVRPAASVLTSFVWLLSPIVYRHEHYSWLVVGFALLPFYFLCAFRLFAIGVKQVRSFQWSALAYMVAAILAVFTDGYTFVMFFVGSSLLLAWAFFFHPSEDRARLMRGLFIHVAAFALAYVLYALYIGQGGYGGHSNDFFRGWGVDLLYVLIPSHGIHWLPDLVGMSVPRSDEMHFGDASVWVTTFALPLMIAGAVAFWCVRKTNKLATGLILLGCLAFYLALGPSLKVNSVKPEELRATQPGQESALMSEEHAIMRTGSGILVNIPVFKTMRASYRWMALCFLSFWLMCLLGMSPHSPPRSRITIFALLFVCLILYIPEPFQAAKRKSAYRENFRAIDRELVIPLRGAVSSEERVAFVPYQNDFLVNYCAPVTGFRTYNIGGDKNLEMAQRHWPSEMKTLGWQVNEDSVPYALGLLEEGQADVLIVPYFNTMSAAFSWSKAVEKIGEEKTKLGAFLHAMRKSPGITVEDKGVFAEVRRNRP